MAGEEVRGDNRGPNNSSLQQALAFPFHKVGEPLEVLERRDDKV